MVYLFVDGLAERLRAGHPREPVIAAWGIGEDGRKVLLHLMAGSKEDLRRFRAFFQDMRARGLGDPLIVVSDGAPGIIRAIEECFPGQPDNAAWRIRCRNLAVKMPIDVWPELKARATACYQAPSRAIARDLAKGIRADYASILPSVANYDGRRPFREEQTALLHLRAGRFTTECSPREELRCEDRSRLSFSC